MNPQRKGQLGCAQQIADKSMFFVVVELYRVTRASGSKPVAQNWVPFITFALFVCLFGYLFVRLFVFHGNFL